MYGHGQNSDGLDNFDLKKHDFEREWRHPSMALVKISNQFPYIVKSIRKSWSCTGVERDPADSRSSLDPCPPLLTK